MRHEYLESLCQSLQEQTSIATIDNEVLLGRIKDKNLVVYFYPKDKTPGCTTESKDFTASYEEFQKLNTEIIGISRDSLASHTSFKDKYNFSFELISDFDSIICEKFKVLKDKTILGIGLERSTFLFDKDGTLVKEWRKVTVKEHVDQVMLVTKDI